MVRNIDTNMNYKIHLTLFVQRKEFWFIGKHFCQHQTEHRRKVNKMCHSNSGSVYDSTLTQCLLLQIQSLKCNLWYYRNEGSRTSVFFWPAQTIIGNFCWTKRHDFAGEEKIDAATTPAPLYTKRSTSQGGHQGCTGTLNLQ